jgi:hypothetical protein
MGFLSQYEAFHTYGKVTATVVDLSPAVSGSSISPDAALGPTCTIG